MKALKYLLGIIVLLVLAFVTLGMLNPELSYESRALVAAPAAETFAVFNDPERMGEWLRGLESIELISGENNVIGSKSRLVFEENGEVIEVTEELTAFEENALYGFKLDSDVLTSNVEVRFVPVDSMNTEIVAKTSYAGKNLVWRSVLALARSSMAERDQDSYARLKELVEGSK